jgi:hypothetical protein
MIPQALLRELHDLTKHQRDMAARIQVLKRSLEVRAAARGEAVEPGRLRLKVARRRRYPLTYGLVTRVLGKGAAEALRRNNAPVEAYEVTVTDTEEAS